MNQKRSVSVSLRFTAEEIEQCQALLERVGIPSLPLSAFMHDKLVATVATELGKPSPKKGAGE